MKIIFKEVGQGDSIIIEWTDGENKIGIIDCNKKPDQSNPILNHLISKGYTSIDFILLSHPHTDHFSGMNELFEHCERNKVTIGTFLTTSFNDVKFLLASVTGIVAKKEIEQLYYNAIRLYKSGIIKDVGYASYLTKFELCKDSYLHFLGPHHEEISAFTKKVLTGSLPNEIKINQSDANLLSTLIKVVYKDNYVILSSDTVKNAFRRLLVKGMVNFKKGNGEMLLGQLAHHGSEKNYWQGFWSYFRPPRGLPAVISVGNQYGHPSPNVCKNMTISNYTVYQTNLYNPIATAATVGSPSHLNLISIPIISPVTTHMHSKDWTYDFLTNQII